METARLVLTALLLCLCTVRAPEGPLPFCSRTLGAEADGGPGLPMACPKGGRSRNLPAIVDAIAARAFIIWLFS